MGMDGLLGRPASMVPSSPSTGAIVALFSCIHFIMTPKSIDINPFSKTMPNSEAQYTSQIARADQLNSLLGTHPTFKQSPPARFSLIIELFAPL
jgi:hypothetical protein